MRRVTLKARKYPPLSVHCSGHQKSSNNKNLPQTNSQFTPFEKPCQQTLTEEHTASHRFLLGKLVCGSWTDFNEVMGEKNWGCYI